MLRQFSAEVMKATIRGWKDELVRLHQRIGDLFPRSEVRERSLAYLEGLLSGCERKNSWQVAEYVGDASPYGMQYLLDRARCDADAVQVRLSECVREELGSRMRCWFWTRRDFSRRDFILPGCSARTAARRGGARRLAAQSAGAT